MTNNPGKQTLSCSGHISAGKACLWEARCTAEIGTRRRLLTQALLHVEAARAIGFELERVASKDLEPLAKLNLLALDEFEETIRQLEHATRSLRRTG